MQLLELEEHDGLVSDSLVKKIRRVRDRMTSYVDGGSLNWPASPGLFETKTVFPIVVDVIITVRLVPPATGSDTSRQPSAVSPHRDCFG